MKNEFTKMTRELLADELQQLGRLLDAYELKQISCAPSAYRKAARVAGRIVSKYSLCPVILEVVAVSPALRDLRSNAGFEKAIELGLLVLPREVTCCLVRP